MESRRGRPTGFKLSKTSKEKISSSREGVKHSELTKSKIANSVKNYHKSTKPTLIQSVERILIKEGHILDDRLPDGTINKIAKILKANRSSVKSTIVNIRKNSDRKIRPYRRKRTKESIFHEALKKAEFLMKSPKKWGFAVKIIIENVRKLPEEGYAVLIGTPNAIAFSNQGNSKYEIIMTEYNLAYILSLTSKELRIEIGNKVSKEKADGKADLWEHFDTFNLAKIRRRTIDKKSFMNIIDQVANKALREGTICKVVLVTSGHWNGSKNAYRKYGMDLGFKNASIKLTTLYPNLHIFSSIFINDHDFKAVYVHKGKEKTLNAKPAPYKAGH